MFFNKKKKDREMAEKERLIQSMREETFDKIDEAAAQTRKTTKLIDSMGITEAFMAATGVGRKHK